MLHHMKQMLSLHIFITKVILLILNFVGRASVIFTIDSDLLWFGVKRVFFFSKETSEEGYEIDLGDINKIDSFKGFTFDMFLTTWILSGCDYLPSIKGIGFVKAKKYVEESKTFKKVYKKLKDDVNLEIPPDYKDNFTKALLTFNFQIVFCPERNELVHLKDVKGHPL